MYGYNLTEVYIMFGSLLMFCLTGIKFRALNFSTEESPYLQYRYNNYIQMLH